MVAMIECNVWHYIKSFSQVACAPRTTATCAWRTLRGASVSVRGFVRMAHATWCGGIGAWLRARCARYAAQSTGSIGMTPVMTIGESAAKSPMNAASSSGRPRDSGGSLAKLPAMSWSSQNWGREALPAWLCAVS